MGTASMRQKLTLVKWLTAAVVGSIIFLQARIPFFTAPQQLVRPAEPLGGAFAIDLERDSFTLRGELVRILSGSVHYFRTPPELWLERLMYARAAGLNTIDTFVEWSSHEPEEGHFDFQGQQDIVSFLETAHRLGLMVILRPGPYIGSQRDMGGLPYWLLRNGSDISLRTMDERYVAFADRYLVELFKRVRHLLIKNGGPIIMFQVESQYGESEECDHAYLQHLRDLMRSQLGNDTVLFTTHSVKASATSCGRIDGVFAAVAFGRGTNVSEAFAVQRRFQNRGPLFVSELYTGWYDQWMTPHRHVKSRSVAETLREVLVAGGSANLYMFHGGTSFGFTAGASMVKSSKHNDVEYRPIVTSYDFNAPLTEAGDPTKKFSAVRDVVAEANGLMLYDVNIPVQPHWPSWLVVNGIRDEGYVHLDDGIVANVTLDQRVLTNWTMRPVPLTNAAWLTNYIKMLLMRKKMLARAAEHVSEVRVLASKFKLPSSEAADTFLKPHRMTKGIAFLNGFNLGRYWPRRGPQKTLYVPRTVFKEENLLVLVELEGGPLRHGEPCVVHFVQKAELNGTIEKASH
ncbi:beta-galactosidase-like [Amblyomma americanum]